jgi:hypothetical protein
MLHKVCVAKDQNLKDFLQLVYIIENQQYGFKNPLAIYVTYTQKHISDI